MVFQNVSGQVNPMLKLTTLFHVNKTTLKEIIQIINTLCFRDLIKTIVNVITAVSTNYFVCWNPEWRGVMKCVDRHNRHNTTQRYRSTDVPLSSSRFLTSLTSLLPPLSTADHYNKQSILSAAGWDFKWRLLWFGLSPQVALFLNCVCIPFTPFEGAEA